jgi:anthranilate phosphoribosyltransferase
LLERRDLPEPVLPAVMRALVTGEYGEAEAAALLTALRMKGESAAEIAAAAAALRAEMVTLPTGRDDVLDTCGPGGSGRHTFNISTAAALVAAGAGVPVVKHGNRAVSGRCGSADVLAELGVPVESGPAWAARSLAEAGLAFCFAPHFHPTMARLGSVRRRLGVRTILNLLGPLANPAGAAYQLLGVGQPELLDRLAEALARLGVRQAVLVSGHDGLDEVSLSAPTRVRRVRGGAVTAWEWAPEDFGLEPCGLDELRADGPRASAAVVRGILEGRPGAGRRVVLANAAAALWAAERVGDVAEGVAVARRALDDGRALAVLEWLRGGPGA